MYRTNGRLLGVDGLVMLEREVAPMRNSDEDTSVVKRRTIQAKGADSKRKSRRHCNCDVVIPEPIVDVASNTRDFNSLMVKGGHGGRQRINSQRLKNVINFQIVNIKLHIASYYLFTKG